MDKRITHYYNNELTTEQRKQLLQDAFGNEKLKKEMQEAQQLESLIALHSSQRDEESGAKSLNRFLKERRRERRRANVTALLRYAAIVIACISCTWWLMQHTQESPLLQPMAQELTVPAGQRAHIKLSDGTGVWVNAGSTMRYPSVFGSERRVQIEGEAFFEIAKGERPFIVSAGSIDVKALGTKFNVFCYKGENPVVALTEGSVKVYEPTHESEGVIMREGQLLTVTNTGFELQDISYNTLSWRDGIYAFDHQKLKDIIKKIELYYDVKITVKDSAFLEREYTGKFRQRDGVMEVLRLMQKIHPFTIEKHEEAGEIIIRHKK